MMNDDAIMKKIYEAYRDVVIYGNDEDYELNEEQFQNFRKVFNFFRELADGDEDASIELCDLIPAKTTGGLNATFIVFDVYGKTLEKFREILQYVSAMTIDVEDGDKVCISVTVPGLYVYKG